MVVCKGGFFETDVFSSQSRPFIFLLRLFMAICISPKSSNSGDPMGLQKIAHRLTWSTRNMSNGACKGGSAAPDNGRL